MSYGVHAFAVDFGELKAALGSKDGHLLAQVLANFATDIERMDADDVENELPPTAEVLRRMIFGEAYHEERWVGFKYGYALEYLCWHLGEFLDNSQWSSMHGDWFETVDAALAQAGVSPAVFSTAKLVYRGAPVPIPEPDDFPGIGYLTREEIPAVAAALDAADWSRVTDAEARQSIEQVRGWLHTCQETDCGLVCTYA